MIKKILSFLLVFVLVFAAVLPITATAAETTPSGTSSNETPKKPNTLRNAKLELFVNAIASYGSNFLSIELADNNVTMSSYIPQFQNAVFKTLTSGFYAACSDYEKEEFKDVLTGEVNEKGKYKFKPLKDLILIKDGNGYYDSLRSFISKDSSVGDYQYKKGWYYYQDIYDYLVKAIDYAAVGYADINWYGVPWSYIIPPALKRMVEATYAVSLIPGEVANFFKAPTELYLYLCACCSAKDFENLDLEQVEAFAKQIADAFGTYLCATDANSISFCEALSDVFQNRTYLGRREILGVYFSQMLRDCVKNIPAADKAKYPALYEEFENDAFLDNVGWCVSQNIVTPYSDWYKPTTEQEKTILSVFALATISSGNSNVTVLFAVVAILGGAVLAACIFVERKKNKLLTAAA